MSGLYSTPLPKQSVIWVLDSLVEPGGTWGEEQQAHEVTGLGLTVSGGPSVHSPLCSLPPWALRAPLYLC